MNAPASLLLLAAIVALAVIWLTYEIRHAAPEPMTERQHRAWHEIREDFSDSEYDLLADLDAQLRTVERAVIKEWRDMPYNHETQGL